MITTELDRPLDRSDATNDLVPGMLGLLALLDALAADLSRCAEPREAAPETRADVLVDALLGLMSVRRTLRRWLVPVVAQRPRYRASAPQLATGEAPPTDRRGLLR